jgi:hypothetical protein
MKEGEETTLAVATRPVLHVVQPVEGDFDEPFSKQLENLLNATSGDAIVVWFGDGYVYVRTTDGIVRAPFSLGEFEEVQPCDCCGK